MRFYPSIRFLRPSISCLPPGTPPGLRLAWRAFTGLALPLWGTDAAGIWVMPTRAFAYVLAAAVTTAFGAMLSWVCALGFHRDKRILVDALAAEVLAGPEPDPSCSLTRVA